MGLFMFVYSAIRHVSQGSMRSEMSSNQFGTDSLVSTVLVNRDESCGVLCVTQKTANSAVGHPLTLQGEALTDKARNGGGHWDWMGKRQCLLCYVH